MTLIKSLYQTPEEVVTAKSTFAFMGSCLPANHEGVWYNGRVDTLENPEHVQNFYNFVIKRIPVHGHATMTDRNGCIARAVRMTEEATAVLVRLGTEDAPVFVLYKDAGYEAIANSEFNRRMEKIKKAGLL